MKTLINLLLSLSIIGCAGPYPGPDKQFVGTAQGALAGAGTGAVTGFQVGAGTGPGALVGAGLGAVAGGVQGFNRDREEEQLLDLSAATHEERERAYAHEILSEHYRRRLELHPTRDIFPADLFFEGDRSTLKRAARPLVREIAGLNKKRLPWSRLVVASYVKASSQDSEYAKKLAEKRSREVSDYLVSSGIEPRRVLTRAVIIDQPLLIDPHDSPMRYNQALELIPLDR